MAKPIKETFVLHGKDAQRFVKTMTQAYTKRVRPQELARMRDSFNKLKAISKF